MVKKYNIESGIKIYIFSEFSAIYGCAEKNVTRCVLSICFPNCYIMFYNVRLPSPTCNVDIIPEKA